jgi:hypothetical protein
MTARPPSALDEFREVQAGKKGPGMTGWWDAVLPELSTDQVEGLLQAATEPSISHRTISIVLGRWGFEVSPGAVGHWRRNHVR